MNVYLYEIPLGTLFRWNLNSSDVNVLIDLDQVINDSQKLMITYLTGNKVTNLIRSSLWRINVISKGGQVDP